MCKSKPSSTRKTRFRVSLSLPGRGYSLTSRGISMRIPRLMTFKRCFYGLRRALVKTNYRGHGKLAEEKLQLQNHVTDDVKNDLSFSVVQDEDFASSVLLYATQQTIGVPAPPYIRLSLYRESSYMSSGRFFDGTEIIASHYKVVNFLRNDSHADVYDVIDVTSRNERELLEAHCFLVISERNWKTYASRKIKKMRRNRGFVNEVFHKQICILIMKPHDKEIPNLRISDYEREFPSLREAELIRKSAESVRKPHDDNAALSRKSVHDKRAPSRSPLVEAHFNAYTDKNGHASQERKERKRIKQREKRQAKRSAKGQSL
ncbi:hypothetical protein K491DRAFT_783042 [Lophiostoma macrostomum CBS 122681]|uniref:Uncharacterized protein n=1 Tax=Lophiostoma macrostomum CBS 122681 TaxID=1314788 RepID=A0A6A6SS53_9PLEO|nr:hypothetical protein K491DRAFT_783042 [Lophiostoma macrostomum CBS 122681]